MAKTPNTIQAFRAQNADALQRVIQEFALTNNVQPLSVSAYIDTSSRYFADHCALVVFEDRGASDEI